MSDNIFQAFPAGWDFTPDVGNRYSRAEIFTPLFLVNKMVVDAGIVPSSAVFSRDYDPGVASGVVSRRVLEPAVGSGNFSSVILWHKLYYAGCMSTNATSLGVNFVRACASMYAYDVDAGNLASTLIRFLSRNDYTDFFLTPEYWAGHVQDLLSTPVDTNVVRPLIEDSLVCAVENWEKFFTISGIVGTVWQKFSSDVSATPVIPPCVLDACVQFLRKNVLLFNGLTDVDTISSDSVIPGFSRVVWCWWDISWSSDGFLLDFVENPLRFPLARRDLHVKEMELSKLRHDHYVPAGESLFAQSFQWDSADARKRANTLEKDILSLRKLLS